MKKALLIALCLNIQLSLSLAQRGGPPRRVENPQPFKLEGGSQVEFKTFEASSLNKSAEYSIFLPPSYSKDQTRRFPVIYFLHGMWNDHTSWTVERYGGIPQQIERLMLESAVPEAILVHPNGENSFYTDFLDGHANYEQMVYRDLIAEIDTNYRTIPKSSARAIGGVSMGAYGSLKVAMKHPDIYGTVAALSPIVLTGKDPSQAIMASDSRIAQYLTSALAPVYGMPFDKQHWKKNSLEELAGSADLRDLRVFFAYGTADRYNNAFPMEAGVRRLSQILELRNINHTFKIYKDGPHGWQLVVQNLQEVSEFLTQTF